VIFQTDLEGRIIDISPSIQRNSGYTREEVVGKPMTFIYDNPAEMQVLVDIMRAKGEVVDYVTALRTKSGQLIYVSLYAQLIKDAHGELCGVEGTMRDITERKQAEEELSALTLRQQAILAAVPDIITEVDNNKRYTWSNRAG